MAHPKFGSTPEIPIRPRLREQSRQGEAGRLDYAELDYCILLILSQDSTCVPLSFEAQHAPDRGDEGDPDRWRRVRVALRAKFLTTGSASEFHQFALTCDISCKLTSMLFENPDDFRIKLPE